MSFSAPGPGCGTPRPTVERVTGIEPALSAWEAEVLPLNYTRETARRSPVAVINDHLSQHTQTRGEFSHRAGVAHATGSARALNGSAGGPVMGEIKELGEYRAGAKPGMLVLRGRPHLDTRQQRGRLHRELVRHEEVIDVDRRGPAHAGAGDPVGVVEFRPGDLRHRDDDLASEMDCR